MRCIGVGVGVGIVVPHAVVLVCWCAAQVHSCCLEWRYVAGGGFWNLSFACCGDIVGLPKHGLLPQPVALPPPHTFGAVNAVACDWMIDLKTESVRLIQTFFCKTHLTYHNLLFRADPPPPHTRELSMKLRAIG